MSLDSRLKKLEAILAQTAPPAANAVLMTDVQRMETLAVLYQDCEWMCGAVDRAALAEVAIFEGAKIAADPDLPTTAAGCLHRLRVLRGI